mgnify:CR=1 FL=1
MFKNVNKSGGRECAPRFFMPFPGTFLTGCQGLSPGFLNFLYTGVEKYKRCNFFHTPRIYTL